MDEKSREALVAGFVASGMNSTRARLAVDVGIQAGERAMESLREHCKLAGDPALQVAAESIGLQMAAFDMTTRVLAMQQMAATFGMPTQSVKLDL